MDATKAMCSTPILLTTGLLRMTWLKHSPTSATFAQFVLT
eukprot:COSAG02_NODE_23701_length_710_cov_1.860884_1_plen_39_part_10